MGRMTERTAISNGNNPKVVEMKPNFGSRVLKQVEDRIVYAFARKRRAIKSLACEHRCTAAEIEEILRERLAGEKRAA